MAAKVFFLVSHITRSVQIQDGAFNLSNHAFLERHGPVFHFIVDRSLSKKGVRNCSKDITGHRIQ